MELRQYQRDAVDQTWSYLRQGGKAPLIVAPTGSGKSVIIATMLKESLEWGARCAVITHVKELIAQNHEKFCVICPDIKDKAGIYSAGLGSRSTAEQILFCGIQSVFRKADEIGRLDALFIDEAHLVSPNQETMYRQFITDCRIINPNMRIIGLTATPFRLDSGSLYGEETLFDGVSISIDIKHLIAMKYLARVTSKKTHVDIDLSQVKTRAGDFASNELEAAFDTEKVTEDAITDALSMAQGRKRLLVFCSGVAHAHHVRDCLVRHGVSAECITGDTPSDDRDRIIADHKAGRITALTNANVLTTGYDAPEIDCIIILRATQSTSLYIQIIGRGMRIAPGKEDCLVLDYGGNIERHGPIDTIEIDHCKASSGREGNAPTKVCPKCDEILHASVRVCFCGYEFPKSDPKIDRKSSDAAILSDEIETKKEVWPVHSVEYAEHIKRGSPPDAPRTMRVTYYADAMGLRRISEWVCVEHAHGWAKSKASQWISQRCVSDRIDTSQMTLDGKPITAKMLSQDADELLSFPKSIEVVIGKEWPEIARYLWEDHEQQEEDDDEPPF